jgi:enoyl-CoA hydratase/carnithine racemase
MLSDQSALPMPPTFVITIDRPEARNAVDGATARAPTAAVDRLESRDDLRVGILTGADGVFSAGFGQTEVHYGTVPPEVGMVRLPERIPRNIALELAALVVRNAPPAVAAVKRVVTERTAFRDEDAFVEQDRIVAPVLGSHDAKEGARAFTERRSPLWQGR